MMEMELRDDVFLLLNNYKARNSTSLSAFEDAWHDLNFALIYLASLKKDRAEFLTVLFSQPVSWMRENEDAPLNVRIGALYCMYLLYFTQPLEQHPLPIKLTLADFFCLVDMVVGECRRASLDDPLAVLLQLYRHNAFIFIPAPPPQQDFFTRVRQMANDVLTHDKAVTDCVAHDKQLNLLLDQYAKLSGNSDLSLDATEGFSTEERSALIKSLDYDKSTLL